MHGVNVAAVAAVITFGFVGGCAMPVSERSVKVYEGARLIVGDGRVIENGTLIVDGTKIAQAGAAADVRVPAGATRISETEAVLAGAENPHAALLWLELEASPEGQKILDKIDLAASIYSPGSVHGRLTQGKNISLVAWEHSLKMELYEQDLVKAFGFPRAERK